MSKKQAEAITHENVDDLTDEQLTEFMDGMQTEEPVETDTKDAKAIDPEIVTDDGSNQDNTNDDESAKAEKVDFKRFDYERNRRREAEKIAAEKEAEWARRFDELLKAQKGPQKEEVAPQIPEWDYDPLARMQSVEHRLEEFMSSVRGQTEEQKAAQRQQEQEQWTLATADKTFEMAAPHNPDIQEALNFAIQAVQRELQVKGYYGPAYQQEYRRQLVNYAANAPQDPQEFAEYVRRNARYWGWNGQQQQQGQQTQQAQPVDTGDAQRRARSLSNGGGSPGVSDSITPEQLINMSDKEFDAYIEKHGSVAAAFS